MTTSIRQATPQDVAALIGLLYDSDALQWNALPDHFGAPGKPIRIEFYVKHLLDEENGVILVAERDDAILGLVQLAVFEVRSGPHPRKHPHAKIGDLVVESEHRRLGVGHMLMAAATDWAKARGVTGIELEVWDFNRDAAAFYESLGYHTARHTLSKLIG